MKMLKRPTCPSTDEWIAKDLSIYSFIFSNSVNYVNHVVYYISSTHLSYNWKFVHFDHLHLIPYLPPSSSGNHKADLFPYEFVWFLKYN